MLPGSCTPTTTPPGTGHGDVRRAHVGQQRIVRRAGAGAERRALVDGVRDALLERPCHGRRRRDGGAEPAGQARGRDHDPDDAGDEEEQTDHQQDDAGPDHALALDLRRGRGSGGQRPVLAHGCSSGGRCLAPLCRAGAHGWATQEDGVRRTRQPTSTSASRSSAAAASRWSSASRPGGGHHVALVDREARRRGHPPPAGVVGRHRGRASPQQRRGGVPEDAAAGDDDRDAPTGRGRACGPSTVSAGRRGGAARP